MKEHGIYQNTSPTGNEELPVTPKTSRATLIRTPAKSGNKRKLDQSTEPHEENDDEEAEEVKESPPKKSRKTSGPRVGKKKEAIAMGLAGTNDGSILDDSTAVGELGNVKVEEHDDEV